MVAQALAGLKVLDLTHYIAGPYCTRNLAGFGAEVIKIEKPPEGDPARKIGPFLKDKPGLERSGLFLYLNCNKKSVTLNLKTQTGVAIIKELARDADVIVESFRPGVMDRLGLDHKTLEAVNPRLVMTSISNFGQTGPYRDHKANHLVTWNMSGARYNDGELGKTPIQGGGWLTHYFAGLHALVGTATALFQRSVTGTGQHIDTSMWESAILSNNYPSVIYSFSEQVHSGIGKPILGVFRCKDGHIGLNLMKQPHWEWLCAFLGMPELTGTFPTMKDINEHLDEVRDIISPKVAKREKTELFETGLQWRIPFGMVQTTQEITDSPQHKARKFLQEVEHPVMGRVTMPGAPFKMMETPWQSSRPAPLLGEHNEEIYCDRLGYTRDNLLALRKQGVI